MRQPVSRPSWFLILVLIGCGNSTPDPARTYNDRVVEIDRPLTLQIERFREALGRWSNDPADQQPPPPELEEALSSCRKACSRARKSLRVMTETPSGRAGLHLERTFEAYLEIVQTEALPGWERLVKASRMPPTRRNAARQEAARFVQPILSRLQAGRRTLLDAQKAFARAHGFNVEKTSGSPSP